MALRVGAFSTSPAAPPALICAPGKSGNGFRFGECVAIDGDGLDATFRFRVAKEKGKIDSSLEAGHEATIDRGIGGPFLKRWD